MGRERGLERAWGGGGRERGRGGVVPKFILKAQSIM
jgi:hypothetical protein